MVVLIESSGAVRSASGNPLGSSGAAGSTAPSVVSVVGGTVVAVAVDAVVAGTVAGVVPIGTSPPEP